MSLLRTSVAALALAASGLLSGCVETLAVGTATGIAVAHDRRTTGTVVEDQNIELKAAHMLLDDKQLREHAHINVTSYNLQVLMTGEAPSAELRDRAERMVRSIARVRRVYDEVAVMAPSSLMARSNDALLTAKVKAELFKIDLPGFDPTRVNVTTARGIVYLMGLVRHSEADAASNVARRISGVQKVVRVFEYLD